MNILTEIRFQTSCALLALGCILFPVGPVRAVTQADPLQAAFDFYFAKDYCAAIVYPFAKKNFNWLDTPDCFAAIERVVQSVKANYNIDDNRVYVGGHSDGAHGAFWFALNRRDEFAGFFGFSLLPKTGWGQSFYGNLNNGQPLFSLNGTNDGLFPFTTVAEVRAKLAA